MDTQNKKRGTKAEGTAARFLENKGFSIEQRNYRLQHAEIDIIARKENLLIFVEVKTRTKNTYGHPETFVSPTQQENYHKVATAYIDAIQWNHPIRFDVIAVETTHDTIKITHFQDAF